MRTCRPALEYFSEVQDRGIPACPGSKGERNPTRRRPRPLLGAARPGHAAPPVAGPGKSLLKHQLPPPLASPLAAPPVAGLTSEPEASPVQQLPSARLGPEDALPVFGLSRCPLRCRQSSWSGKGCTSTHPTHGPYCHRIASARIGMFADTGSNRTSSERSLRRGDGISWLAPRFHVGGT